MQKLDKDAVHGQNVLFLWEFTKLDIKLPFYAYVLFDQRKPLYKSQLDIGNLLPQGKWLM